MDSDATVCRRWRSCVRRFLLHLTGAMSPVFQDFAGVRHYSRGLLKLLPDRHETATVATKLKIAKTKPLPIKFYRWNIAVPFFGQFYNQRFQTAIPPLFTAFYLGTKVHGAKKPFLCHFLLHVGALEIGSVSRCRRNILAAQMPPCHKSKR